MSRRLGVALALAAAVAVASGCGSVAQTAAEGGVGNGEQLFVENCGQCHRLADAGTQGTIGPDLDDAFRVVRREHGFEESTIRDVVRGQIAYPVENPPTGEPGMPADPVTGEDADAVAAYVASVAGLPTEGPTEAAGEQETDGKAIFQASCGSCHVLADAGTSGTIGPNLDEAEFTLDEAVQQIRNGGGGMPAFEGQLSDEQIRAVAEYVVETSGR